MSRLRVGVTWPCALTPLASKPIAAPLAPVARSQQRAAPDRLLTWSCEIRGLVRNVTNRFRDFMPVARAQGRLAVLQRYHCAKWITGGEGLSRLVRMCSAALAGPLIRSVFPQSCLNRMRNDLMLLFPVTQIRLERRNMLPLKQYCLRLCFRFNRMYQRCPNQIFVRFLSKIPYGW